jgi:hypothetical protein
MRPTTTEARATVKMLCTEEFCILVELYNAVVWVWAFGANTALAVCTFFVRSWRVLTFVGCDVARLAGDCPNTFIAITFTQESVLFATWVSFPAFLTHE